MNDKQHLSEAEYTSFTQGLMNQEEMMEFLSHVGSCNYCADQLEAYMAGELLPAPRDLKENILTAVKRPEIQLAVKAKAASKQMQLFIYSLKVGTATAGALLLLFLTINFSSLINLPVQNREDSNNQNHFSLTETLRDNMNKLSDNMLNFSNNMIDMEVLNNDKKEK
jgi:hypothetical protein